MAKELSEAERASRCFLLDVTLEHLGNRVSEFAGEDKADVRAALEAVKTARQCVPTSDDVTATDSLERARDLLKGVCERKPGTDFRDILSQIRRHIEKLPTVDDQPAI